MRVFEVIKAGDELYVEGAALIPDRVDAQGDIYDADTIRRAAYSWMEKNHPPFLMHKSALPEGAVTLMESRLLRQTEMVAGEKMPEGTWVVKQRINDSRLKQLITSGRLRGFSIGGRGQSSED